MNSEIFVGGSTLVLVLLLILGFTSEFFGWALGSTICAASLITFLLGVLLYFSCSVLREGLRIRKVLKELKDKK